MKLVQNKLQVRHYPQIPCEPFCVDVRDEYEAKKISDILADQHLFLLRRNIIPDYSNVIEVVMWDENSDGEGTPGWISYYNESENMDWEEFEYNFIK